MKNLIIITLIALAVIGLSNFVTPVSVSTLQLGKVRTEKIATYPASTIQGCAWFVEQVD